MIWSLRTKRKSVSPPPKSRNETPSVLKTKSNSPKREERKYSVQLSKKKSKENIVSQPTHQNPSSIVIEVDDLQKKTSLDESSTIKSPAGERIHYFPEFPLDDDSELKSTISSFLNSTGGRIYFGIQNSRVVGVNLQDKDSFKLSVNQILTNFSGDLKSKKEDYIKIKFLSITSNKSKIEGLCVPKIIV